MCIFSTLAYFYCYFCCCWKIRNYKKPKTDNKKATLNVFKKSKDEKRLKDIKESKEGSLKIKNNVLN